MKYEYQTISSRAKSLLRDSENYEVDFKLNANKVEAVDFVAFANSENGGTLLFGIDEEEGKHSKQIGKIIGCLPTDENKLKILNKALSCTPQVEIEVIFENLSSKPFIRVEIPSGKNKPYCSQKGIYCIRDNGRNRALSPMDLLNMFLENESVQFFNRFNSVASSLNNRIGELETNIEKTNLEISQLFQLTSKKLISHLQDVAMDISEIEMNIDESLKDISNSAENAEDLSDEAMNGTHEALSYLQDLEIKIDNISCRVTDLFENSYAMLDNFKIEYPFKKKQKLKLQEIMQNTLSLRPSARFKTVLQHLEKYYYHNPDDDFKKTAKEIFDKLKCDMKNPESAISSMIRLNKKTT